MPQMVNEKFRWSDRKNVWLAQRSRSGSGPRDSSTGKPAAERLARDGEVLSFLAA